MTMIEVNTIKNRFTKDEKRILAKKLTDAVLVPEIGRFIEEARIGFQVIFNEHNVEDMSVNGKLLCDLNPIPDNINIHVFVMESDWNKQSISDALKNIASVLTKVSNVESPLNSWKTTFQVINEGSWGTGPGVLSIKTLLKSGVFSDKKINVIKKNIK